MGDLRFYESEFGGIKPHLDINSSSDCAQKPHAYTLLIYLTDEFEGGELFVKCKRTEHDAEPQRDPEKLHRVYTFEPRVGYGILFSKSYLHWANVGFGCKRILVTDVASDFAIEAQC